MSEQPAILARATAGHLYCHSGRRVIAMETGAVVRVREIDAAEPLGVGCAYTVNSTWLHPLPMRYFGGQSPGVQVDGRPG